MPGIVEFLLALAAIFAVNLLPAFGPPTWALLVLLHLTWELPAVPLVLGGAVAAASGRLVLAHASFRFRGRFSDERRASLAAAQHVLAGDRRKAAGGIVLFALSPVPSAQLFVAAGLLAVPLRPLTAAFFAGRLVSYSIYLTGASLASASLGDTLTGVFTSPLGLAIQVVMVLGLVALVRVDWGKRLQGWQRRARRGPVPPRHASGGHP